MDITHANLTADVFVIRDGRFLTLERGRGGRGAGFWYLPGGLVERGEDPDVAAARETKEESGLDVRDLRLLRVWTYPTTEGWDTIHATYVAWSDDGEVVLSDEHTGAAWADLDEYLARWCTPAIYDALGPAESAFLRQVERSCALVRPLLVP